MLDTTSPRESTPKLGGRGGGGLMRGVLLAPRGGDAMTQRAKRGSSAPATPTVRIPAELAPKAAALAVASGVPLSAVVAWALELAIATGEAPPPLESERVRCDYDGTPFLRPKAGNGSEKRFCSDSCAARFHERESKRRRRAREAGSDG